MVDSAFGISPNISEINNTGGWGVGVLDPILNQIYITNHRSGTVTVLDGNTDSIIGMIQVGNSSFGLGINLNTDTLFVAREKNDILAIVDLNSGKINSEITMVNPYDVAVNSKTNKVYVTSDMANTLSIIDGKTNTVEKIIPINDPCAVAVNESTNRIFVTSESENSLIIIDGESNEIISRVNVGKSPRGIGVNHLTNMVYVANQLSDTVSIVNVENLLVDTIQVQKTPRRIAVDSDTNTVYVSNHLSGTISVIDGDTQTVIENISVKEPFEITINSIEQKIYSSISVSNILSVVSLNSSNNPNPFTHFPYENKCAPGFFVANDWCRNISLCNPQLFSEKNCPLENQFNNNYLLPKQQVKAGIPSSKTICKNGFELIFKDNALSYIPACVKSESVLKLIERGWGTMYPEISCTLEYAPQCGLDSITYSNMCALKAERIALAYSGRCN